MVAESISRSDVLERVFDVYIDTECFEGVTVRDSGEWKAEGDRNMVCVVNVEYEDDSGRVKSDALHIHVDFVSAGSALVDDVRAYLRSSGGEFGYFKLSPGEFNAEMESRLLKRESGKIKPADNDDYSMGL